MERLQKVISASGLCSRRKAEELIASGRVRVNGKLVDQAGYKVSPQDEVLVDGHPLGREEKVVYLLNKPKNVISSSSDDRGRTTVCDLVDSPYRLYPLGRLDYDSSGLILLSNDGELMQKLIHPSFVIDKTYEVTINKLITAEEIAKLENGVMIDNSLTSPAQIRLIRTNANKKTSFLTVTIHEGRNRQVRKMFLTIGAQVVRLHRISEATVQLGNLKPGEYRMLKPREVVLLKRFLDGNNI